MSRRSAQMRVTRRVGAGLGAALLGLGIGAVVVPPAGAQPGTVTFNNGPTPQRAAIGADVTLHVGGVDVPLGPCEGVFVSFNGTPATSCTHDAKNAFSVQVPAGATSGYVTLSYDSAVVQSPHPLTIIGPGLRLSVASIHPGGTVTMAGSGFQPGETVAITLGGAAWTTTTATAGGAFHVKATVPTSTAPQPTVPYTVAAVGQTSGASAQNLLTVTTDWPAFGRLATHGFDNRYEYQLGTSNAPTLAATWDVPLTGTTGAVSSSPAVVGPYVFIGGANGQFDAFNVGTHAEVASLQAAGPVLSSPTVEGSTTLGGSDTIFVGAGNSVQAYVFTPGAGGGGTFAIEWTTATNGAVTSSPVVSRGEVYVGSSDGTIDALNAGTGQLNWSYTTGGAVTSSPVVDKNQLFVGSDDGHLYCLDVQFGGNQAATLDYKVALSGPVEASPSIESDGSVFITSDATSSTNATVYSIDAATGTIDWQEALADGTSAVASPAFDLSNGVYVATTGGDVYAFSAGDGSLTWTAMDGNTQGGLGDLTASPAEANGVLYEGSSNGTLYAIDTGTGHVLAAVQTGGPIASSAAVSDGVVYVGSNDGSLWAFSG